MNSHALPVFRRSPFPPPQSPVRDGDLCRSALEQNHPRIVDEICRLWGYPELHAYLYKLGIDERGTRMGFAPDVFQEISMLLCVHQEIVPRQ